MTRVGGLAASIVTMPQNAVALLAIEVAGGAALYALHRLLREDSGFRDPGPLCL
jgi:phosphoribosylcarboxyaminoimidazole (NCAIR) mutase